MLWTCNEMSGCLVWTHLSLTSRSASAGFSHGASTCLTRDRTRSTSSSSLRTLQKKKEIRTKKKKTLILRRTELWCGWFGLPDRKRWNWIDEGCQQGYTDRQHCEDDDNEEFLRRQADSITQTHNIWICWAPGKLGWGPPAQVQIPGQHCCRAPFVPLCYRPTSSIYESDYLTCQHSEPGVRCSSHSFLKSHIIFH